MHKLTKETGAAYVYSMTADKRPWGTFMVGSSGGGEKLAARRHAAMARVVSSHESELLRYATRITGDANGAQDVVQNVFIKLFSHWQNGSQPTDKLRGWLYRVTHNDAVDHIRREARIRRLHEAHAQGLADSGPAAGEKNDDRREQVLQQLDALGDTEKQVLLLRLESGFSYREIAEITGRSEGNVGYLLHHAVRKISSRLQREQDSPKTVKS